MPQLPRLDTIPGSQGGGLQGSVPFIPQTNPDFDFGPLMKAFANAGDLGIAQSVNAYEEQLLIETARINKDVPLADRVSTLQTYMQKQQAKFGDTLPTQAAKAKFYNRVNTANSGALNSTIKLTQDGIIKQTKAQRENLLEGVVNDVTRMVVGHSGLEKDLSTMASDKGEKVEIDPIADVEDRTKPEIALKNALQKISEIFYTEEDGKVIHRSDFSSPEEARQGFESVVASVLNQAVLTRVQQRPHESKRQLLKGTFPIFNPEIVNGKIQLQEEALNDPTLVKQYLETADQFIGSEIAETKRQKNILEADLKVKKKDATKGVIDELFNLDSGMSIVDFIQDRQLSNTLNTTEIDGLLKLEKRVDDIRANPNPVKDTEMNMWLLLLDQTGPDEFQRLEDLRVGFKDVNGKNTALINFIAESRFAELNNAFKQKEKDLKDERLKTYNTTLKNHLKAFDGLITRVSAFKGGKESEKIEDARVKIGADYRDQVEALKDDPNRVLKMNSIFKDLSKNFIDEFKTSVEKSRSSIAALINTRLGNVNDPGFDVSRFELDKEGNLVPFALSNYNKLITEIKQMPEKTVAQKSLLEIYAYAFYATAPNVSIGKIKEVTDGARQQVDEQLEQMNEQATQ